MKQYFSRIFTLLAAFAVCATVASSQEPASSPPPKSSPAPAHSSAPGPATAAAHRRAPDQLPWIPGIPSETTQTVSVVMTFGFPVLIVALVVYGRYRRTRLLHETLRVMVEKGVTIPPELLAPPKPPTNDSRRGVLCISLGIGLMGLLWFHAGKGEWSIGLVPVMLGVGYLLAARLGAKPPTSPESKLP